MVLFWVRTWIRGVTWGERHELYRKEETQLYQRNVAEAGGRRRGRRPTERGTSEAKSSETHCGAIEAEGRTNGNVINIG